MPEEKTAKLRRVPATEQSKNQLYEDRKSTRLNSSHIH